MSDEWEVWLTLNSEKHVIPRNDLRPHNNHGFNCWCLPYETDGIIVHNSADKRELSESNYQRRGGKQ